MILKIMFFENNKINIIILENWLIKKNSILNKLIIVLKY